LSDNLNGNEIGKLASLASMPDEITINDVSKERNMGDEWSQIKSYLNSGDYNKALALLQLLHQ